MSTDSEWQKLGKENPYFAVVTEDKYQKDALTASRREEFFESGQAFVSNVVQTIRTRLNPNPKFSRALDFGCGVGRLLIPLARISGEAVGVDVSEGMLAEARKNCEDRSVTNVSLVKSDDELSLVNGKFDLIHSYIVFQHIPVQRGERIFLQLLERLVPGGIGVFHFTYAKAGLSARRERMVARVKTVPFVTNVQNMRRGRGFSSPVMQMNSYNLNDIFRFVQELGVTSLHAEFTNHEGALGVIVYLMKP
jgi:SAM-dependent methyltransferase